MDRFHQLAPKLWRHTENLTGDYVFDASIAHCKNPDMKHKLGQHIIREGYGPRTNYSGYSGLSGDD
jgi:hypothetical protein